MASQGPFIAGSGGDGVNAGAAPWSNPENITASDGQVASANMGLTLPPNNGTTDSLTGQVFGFSIPGNATINGIVASINHYASLSFGSDVVDQTVKLTKGGPVIGDNKASASAWPSSPATASYGSSSDLWGTTWTPGEINATTFGLVLEAASPGQNNQANVDYFSLTVYYTSGDHEELMVSKQCVSVP